MRPLQHLLLIGGALAGIALALPWPQQSGPLDNQAIPAILKDPRTKDGLYIGAAAIIGHLTGVLRWTKREKDMCADLIEAWYEQDSFRKFGDRPYRWQSREYSIESCKDKKSFDFAQETWYAERRLPTPPEAANGRLDSQQEFSDGEIVPPENTNNNFGSVVDNADPAVKTTVGAIMGAGSFAAAAGNTLKAMWNGDGFSGSASSELSPS